MYILVKVIKYLFKHDKNKLNININNYNNKINQRQTF